MSFGEVIPTRCQLLNRHPRPSYCVPGLPYQNFHAGFGSIPATKKRNATSGDVVAIAT
ncbi:MAG: hypothetical protein ACJ74X_10970 [Gaiellaceae bacterium]